MSDTSEAINGLLLRDYFKNPKQVELFWRIRELLTQREPPRNLMFVFHDSEGTFCPLLIVTRDKPAIGTHQSELAGHQLSENTRELCSRVVEICRLPDWPHPRPTDTQWMAVIAIKTFVTCHGVDVLLNPYPPKFIDGLAEFLIYGQCYDGRTTQRLHQQTKRQQELRLRVGMLLAWREQRLSDTSPDPS